MLDKLIYVCEKVFSAAVSVAVLFIIVMSIIFGITFKEVGSEIRRSGIKNMLHQVWFGEKVPKSAQLKCTF